MTDLLHVKPPTAAANVDRAEIGKFDSVAHRFWDPEGEFRALHRLNPVRFGYVQARVSLPDSRVLDVGCGGGLLAESLASAGARVTAIDLAPTMISTAQLHAIESGLQIDYRVASAESLVAEWPAHFDVVCCMEMLEHVPDPQAALAALAALARPGGSVMLSTINRNLRSFLLAIVGAEYVGGLVPRGTHEFERLIRPAELARWARGAGLVLKDISGLEYNPLNDQCRLTRDPAVNYLAHFGRPG